MANSKTNNTNIVAKAKADVAAKQKARKAEAKAAKPAKTVTIKVSTIIFATLIIVAVGLSYALGTMQSASHNAEVTREAVQVVASLK